jgi:hypothetical protein
VTGESERRVRNLRRRCKARWKYRQMYREAANRSRLEQERVTIGRTRCKRVTERLEQQPAVQSCDYWDRWKGCVVATQTRCIRMVTNRVLVHGMARGGAWKGVVWAVQLLHRCLASYCAGGFQIGWSRPETIACGRRPALKWFIMPLKLAQLIGLVLICWSLVNAALLSDR